MVKTLSFGILHYSVAFLVVYALSGDLLISSLAGAIEPGVNTVVFHFHEKFWVRYGPAIDRFTHRMRAYFAGGRAPTGHAA